MRPPNPSSRRREARALGCTPVTGARERLALAAVLAAIAAWALVPTYPDYDAYHHLVWGRDLLDGVAPGFETFAAPTEHPLYLALAALLSLAGEHADRLLVLTTMLSLVALVAGAYALGRALFGVQPALLGALFVGSSFAFLLYAVRAFVDVPFLALVVWAAALKRPSRGAARCRWRCSRRRACCGPRRGCWRARTGYGACADAVCARGLRSRRWRRRSGVLGARGSAVTGDPLYSLHATSKLAESLGRVRGLENVPSAFVTFLADVARPPVALAGLAGLVLAVRRFGVARMAVPIGLLGVGALTFVATGIAGLSIIQRYLTVPAVALCVLAGYAVLGFTTLEPGWARERWRAAAAGAVGLGGGLLAGQAADFGGLRAALRLRGQARGALHAVRGAPAVRGDMRCGAQVSEPSRRPPGARGVLDPAGRRVRSRAGPARRGAGAVYLGGGEE